jgi:hypothetical protein
VNGSSGDYHDDQSFAEVVNNLSGGPWRVRRRRRNSQRQAPPRVTSGPASELPASAHDHQRTESEKWSEPEAGAAVARPYTWTQGRTAPVMDLGIETLVSTTEHGHDMAVLTCAEHRAVAELCGDPRSVAEVAALLSLPLGVARVVLADMAAIGLVIVHSNTYSGADTPDMALMERVLSGLRRL